MEAGFFGGARVPSEMLDLFFGSQGAGLRNEARGNAEGVVNPAAALAGAGVIVGYVLNGGPGKSRREEAADQPRANPTPAR